MSESKYDISTKAYWIRQVKSLAKNALAYRNGYELVAMMDYYNVTNLSVLTTAQIYQFYVKRVSEIEKMRG